MGIFDDRDQALDPSSLLHWRPAPPDRAIPCACGAWVDLTRKRNACSCGLVYDIYARVIGDERQAPTPQVRDEDD